MAHRRADSAGRPPPGPRLHPRTTAVALVAAVLLVAVACGSTSPSSSSGASAPSTANGDVLIAQVASFDLAADRPQRVLVGLQTNDNRLVNFGTATFAFTYQGNGEGGTPEPGPTADGTWIPVAGQKVQMRSSPAMVSPADGVGVYEATDVDLDKPGFWTVDVTIDLDGATRTTEAAFEVRPTHLVPAAGDPAPPSTNRLAGDTSVAAKSIDSRAGSSDEVPDPELHAMTVADAITTGKPTVVVVSTPTYCVSKFCGPITESIEALAAETGDQANFIHIEVWSNYEETAINKSAADWIYREGDDDAHEPWVFLVDADGAILQRWDNVTSDESLQAALSAALGTAP